MAHATYMAAMNAARKQFGKDWKEAAAVEKVDGQWYVQVKQIEAPAQEAPAPEAPAFLAHEPVAAPSAPAPAPALPAFLMAPTAPVMESAPEAAAAQAAGDAAANAALVENPFNHIVCPVCQSTELYTGRVNEAGVVVDEDKMIGCHHCEWVVIVDPAQVEKNKTDAQRPRLSTAEKPTKKVWSIADSMPGAKRKEVIEECVRQGIAYGTARTQYQHWFKCINDQKATPVATIGADGKITMPGNDA